MTTPQQPDVRAAFGLVLQVGLSMCASIVFFFGIGLGLDRLLGTAGVGMMIGLLVGVGCGFYLMYRQIMSRIPEIDTSKKP